MSNFSIKNYFYNLLKVFKLDIKVILRYLGAMILISLCVRYFILTYSGLQVDTLMSVILSAILSIIPVAYIMSIIRQLYLHKDIKKINWEIDNPDYLNNITIFNIFMIVFVLNISQYISPFYRICWMIIVGFLFLILHTYYTKNSVKSRVTSGNNVLEASPSLIPLMVVGAGVAYLGDVTPAEGRNHYEWISSLPIENQKSFGAFQVDTGRNEYQGISSLPIDKKKLQVHLKLIVAVVVLLLQVYEVK